MSHPLLTKVLAEALLLTFCWDRRPEAVSKDAGIIVRAIPPDIADRLEAALDECQYFGCGRPMIDADHVHDEREAPHEGPEWWCHPYQPLVTP